MARIAGTVWIIVVIDVSTDKKDVTRIDHVLLHENPDCVCNVGLAIWAGEVLICVPNTY